MSRGLHKRVAEGIVSRGLWSPDQRVAVAVSGGLDSTVLLDLLVATRGIHRGCLLVATVDHGMRPDAAGDAAKVVADAVRLGLPWRAHRIALGPDASEDEARTARYAWLRGLDADVIALAHHEDDQVENLLLGLLRGHGARGLSGMAPRRDRLARPLLDVARAELLAWARDRGLAWCEDPSNAEVRFLRNRVRHGLLPLIEGLRPGARGAIARTGRLLAEDEALLATLAEGHPPPWTTDFVANGPAPIVRRALLAALGEATGAQVDAILVAARRGRGVVRMSEHVTIVVNGKMVRIVGAALEGADPG